ncbi:MAG: hypothetical protein H7249_10005 [Chitinophagaceae bacterium]|nr:hypothetical protein [Oligoflexus sp.]
MRKKVYSLVLLGTFTAGGLIAGLSMLECSLHYLEAKAPAARVQSHADWPSLVHLARERAWLYEQAIERDHLSQGMVVNRSIRGKIEGACDSLMFSSLRTVALFKLGQDVEADRAWSHIAQKAYDKRRWVRHPDCKWQASSRDMIVGLMAALSQEPVGFADSFVRLLNVIERTGGSIDDGPFYVSRVSPGMAEILKNMAIAQGYREEQLPTVIRMGFVTLEFDTLVVTPGYRAHLNALMLWIELELIQRHPELEMRSLSGLLDGINSDWGSTFTARRRAFAAEQLFKLDPKNIFFEYLYLRTAGILTRTAKAELLQRLLAMPQFPEGRLPNDCDRPADYLWQRRSTEYERVKACRTVAIFHGVDFLWMVALLTEPESPQRGRGN